MLRKVFFNQRELRAGWRFALYVALVFAFGLVAYFLIRLLRGPAHRMSELTVSTVMIRDAVLFLLFIIPALIMCRIERRTLGDYGLTRSGAFGSRFWEGIVWGVGLMAATIGLLVVLGICHIRGFALPAVAGLEYGIGWAIAFVLVGLTEEFAFRGYTQFSLTTGMGFWPAALLLSGTFAAAHFPNAGETWVGTAGVFLAAMILALPLRRTGALWFSIGLHAGWDWMETFFFGVPNSGMQPRGYLLHTSFSGSRWMTGGTVGPEGSVIAIVVVILGLGLLHFRFPQVQYPRQESLKPPVRASQAAAVVTSATP